jgi:hypothetical protein
LELCSSQPMAAKRATPSKKEKELKEKFDKSKQDLKDLKGEIKSLKEEIKLLKKNHIDIDDNSNIIRIKHEFEINQSLLSWVEASKLSQPKMHMLIHTALQIGILAKMQGKVSHTLSMFKKEIDSELGLIQSYMATIEYKFRKDSSYKTSLEEVVAEELNKHLIETGKKDTIVATGAQSEDGTSKKGDVTSTIMEGGVPKNMAIEVKFAQEYQKGDVRQVTTKGLRADPKQFIEQALGSRSNRTAEYCIFVVDAGLRPFEMNGRTIEFFPEVKGFIAVVDVENDRHESLRVAYDLARSMTITQQPINFDYGVLSFLLQDLELTMRRQIHITNVGTNILTRFNTHNTEVVKSLNSTRKKIEQDIELFEGELAATKKAISEMRRLITSFLVDGELSPKELRQMWLKEKENSLYLTAKNDAKEWMDSVNARLEEEDAKNAEKINPENADDKVSDIQLSETAYEDMKVQELKELLKAAGKPVSGKKPDLIARLNE